MRVSHILAPHSLQGGRVFDNGVVGVDEAFMTLPRAWIATPAILAENRTGVNFKSAAEAIGLRRRQDDGAAAHAGRQLGRLAGDHADHLDRLAHRIDTAAEPCDAGRIDLVGLLDANLEAITGLEPAEPARGRDQLDLEIAVVEDIEQRLAGRGVLELARLLLDRDAREGRRDRAFRRDRLGGRDVGLRLLDLGRRDVELELSHGFERDQARVDREGLVGWDLTGARARHLARWSAQSKTISTSSFWKDS